MPEENRPKTANGQTFNIQDGYFARLRRDKTVTTIYLVNGVKLLGRIKSFDKFSIMIENNHQEQLIFKHAISTITYNRHSYRSSYPPQAGQSHYDRYPDDRRGGGSGPPGGRNRKVLTVKKRVNEQAGGLV